MGVSEDNEFESVGVYELLEAFRRFLQEHPEAPVHEVDAERLSVTERIHGILDQFTRRDNLLFRELFSEKPDRHEIVVTFLAMLELVKLRRITSYNVCYTKLLRTPRYLCSCKEGPVFRAEQLDWKKLGQEPGFCEGCKI